MKERILEIINGKNEPEPINQLHFEFKKLINNIEREEFLSIIKFFALNGQIKQKYVCLTVLVLLVKVHECESIIKKNIDEFQPQSDKMLIAPLVTSCAIISKKWSIAFIENVINLYKPKHNEYSSYFDIGLRNIVITEFWKQEIENIKLALERYDNDFFIDFLAFFKWKKNNEELLVLYEVLNKNEILSIKLKKLMYNIEARYKNNYSIQ